jgi:hypothetical protein
MRLTAGNNWRHPIARLGRLILRVLKGAMVAVWALAALCLLFYAALYLYFVFVEDPALARLRGDASAVNNRGDEVWARTERDAAAPPLAKTVITLKPAHGGSAATLLVAESKNYLVGFKWRDDDHLILQLDFGCKARLTAPVERVGPIRIVYRFGNLGHPPPHGYDSFPDDRPRKPCR